MIELHLNEASDLALQDFDKLMVESSLKCKTRSKMAESLWGQVIAELVRRKLVTHISGVFTDIKSLHVVRSYDLEPT